MKLLTSAATVPATIVTASHPPLRPSIVRTNPAANQAPAMNAIASIRNARV